jgi:peptidoglycan/xylan/chitin deacetylase (PgdA/CDA1 family)
VHATDEINSTPRPSVLRQIARRLLGAAVPHRWFALTGSAAGGAAYLTFDDGPHPEHTPRLLDVLRRERALATFFIVGRNAERHPEIVRRIAAEGHSIANHTYTHGDPLRTSAPVLLDEVRRTRELLARLSGQSVALFRPPHGKVTAVKLVRLWVAGQSVVLWNVDPKDFECTSAEELAAAFRRRPINRGDIVLLHDTFPHAADVLSLLIAEARERGISFVPMKSLRQRSIRIAASQAFEGGVLEG